MYKLLVVDDEAQIRAIIRKYAEFEGYMVTEAADGMEAVNMVKRDEFDLIIMDIMMPELDGFSACGEINKIKSIPTIMLSARGEEYDKIHGFEIGIDDYVVKPFSPRELMMRVKAVLSRSLKYSGVVSDGIKRDIFVSDGLKVDFTAREVMVDNQVISMTPKEYDLLFYMVKNRKVALSRERLITDVWGYDYFGDDRTLDTHIKLLRSSLGPYRKYLVTLRGVGYKFEG